MKYKHPLMMALVGVLASYALVLPGAAVTPDRSNFFVTAYVEESDSYNTQSDGDLWPSCWSDDNYLYAANGDGKGFNLSGTFADIAVSRINGHPPNLTGTTVASGNISQVWSDPSLYNRKPTGMVCIDGALYVAVQDLRTDFNDAPAATIAKSTDKGVTWTWNRAAPMFSNYIFTTIMFLDYGQDNQNAIDQYIYAYGMDNNWRDSFNDRVPDPTQLYLARVPKASIQDRSAWEFFTGLDANGSPGWSADISMRAPVLQDDRRVYADVHSTDGGPSNMTVISQGSIVYNKPLKRYIYTSWTEYTFEFYEAPQPWGPWKLFLSKDFGWYPWTDTKNGGYATTIPSKFISADGRTVYVQSNTFMGGVSNYNFSLRKMFLEPFSNISSDTNNLARTAQGIRPIDKVAHFGNVRYFNNGVLNESEDSWNNEIKGGDWWGYIWNRTYNVNKVVYTTGTMFSDGGWYNSGLRVQVRQDNTWVDVTGLSIAPAYPYNSSAGPHRSFILTFDETWAEGIRLIGVPGGSKTFTSIGELEVYYDTTRNLVRDSGFENQPANSISAPWVGAGNGDKGIDRGIGLANSDANNAWIRTSAVEWNAIEQEVAVKPDTSYLLTGWIRNSNNFDGGYFGVRHMSGSVLAEVNYAGLPVYTRLAVPFNSGINTTVTVFAGYHSPGVDSWVQVDDIAIVER